jgi:hypothetical protein
MKLKLVCVTWIDARTDGGWFEHDPKKPRPNPPLKSYGLLVERNEESIILASTYDPECNRWSDRMEIPAGMLKSVRTIKTVEA